jgi:hypothetical protein
VRRGGLGGSCLVIGSVANTLRRMVCALSMCFALPGSTACMRGKVMKEKFIQLHALERAVLSQQQQLMQIRAQKLRVLAATACASQDFIKATDQRSHQQQLESCHRSDTVDLKRRITFTKARFVTSKVASGSLMLLLWSVRQYPPKSNNFPHKHHSFAGTCSRLHGRTRAGG